MDGQLIAFVGVAAGMVAMPGADFTVVVRSALASRRAGVACAVGVAGGLLVHTALAIAGLAAVLIAVPALYRALQIVGGAYVLYLGVQALRGALRATGESSADTAGERAAGRALRQGFLTNVLNPKAPVLFLSLLPQFVPEGAAVLPRTLLLASVVVLLALLWFPLVAVLVDRLGHRLRRPRTARTVQGVTGGMLAALGVTLLVSPGH
ncbi:LysE family translocator [Streptomyces sp. Je 1-79]|uniref:LysE family translocator n=1 Tax=Streptomyces sp. Je 1-79 TaxID=2943847 RepID=UPI0021A93B4B|nr:LysE family translocator [Streptomyces sp. Je 1-79]MCT4353668.1 LysE family translocator [Streptomyces sp. Je 1-79]